MPKAVRKKAVSQRSTPGPVPPVAARWPDRRPPVPDEEILVRLNELIEAERAGIEAAAVLQRTNRRGVTDTEVKKFAEDESAACAGLHRAILGYGGQPSTRTGDFGRKVADLTTEGERLNLMARGQVWVVRRLDVLLGMPVDAKTRSFLAEMREEHLENIDACNRRAEELSAPPSPPYRDLPFARLREAHDRLYYGPWRSPLAMEDEEIPLQPDLHPYCGSWRASVATTRDYQRAYFQLGRHLRDLADEVQRARSIEARRYLAKARRAYAAVVPETAGEGTVRDLDSALSYAHSALNALLRQYRAPAHDPRAFESFSNLIGLPFQDLV